MKATLITLSIHNPKTGERLPDKIVPGWLVPNTADIFAIDQRDEGDAICGIHATWKVTHIPTGYSVPGTDSTNMAQAIARAQRMFQFLTNEAGLDLAAAGAVEIATAFKAVDKDRRASLKQELQRL